MWLLETWVSTSGVLSPAHQALKQVIATKAGHRPETNWRWPPGRPRKTWIQQIGDGTLPSWRQMWQSAEERGHRGELSQRTTAVYALWWWWWWWWCLRPAAVLEVGAGGGRLFAPWSPEPSDQQLFAERRSGTKLFAGAAFSRVPAPLQPWWLWPVPPSGQVERERGERRSPSGFRGGGGVQLGQMAV